jgi:dihydropyrimidinase
VVAVTAEHDLVVRGGMVVTAGGQGDGGRGRHRRPGVQLGGEMRGRRELDARGALVLPGGVDMHVHLSQPPGGAGRAAWVDDFGSGSAAAIAGGITTIGNMTFPPEGLTLRQALDTDDAAAAGASAVDYVLHPVLPVPTPEALAELPGLAADGFRTLKIFMVMDEFEEHTAGMIEAIRLAGRLGMAHPAALRGRRAGPVRRGAAGRGRAGRARLSTPRAGRCTPSGPRSSGRWRSARRPVRRCASCTCPRPRPCPPPGPAGPRGLPVFVEARPMYLHLTSELLRGPDAGAYIGRRRCARPPTWSALWAGLADGSVHTVGSDHAPWSKEAKVDPGLDVTTARQGVSDLETHCPMLMSAGVAEGRPVADPLRRADLDRARPGCTGSTRARARSRWVATPT